MEAKFTGIKVDGSKCPVLNGEQFKNVQECAYKMKELTGLEVMVTLFHVDSTLTPEYRSTESNP